MSELDILFPIPTGSRNADDMGMPAEMWNALFGEPAKTRMKVFELHGWKVQQGTFTPNAGVTGAELAERPC